MNRRTPVLPLANAVRGFLLYKTAEALSRHTLRSYQDHLKLWLNYAGEVAVEGITPADLSASRSVAWLRHEYHPRRITGNTAPLAAKTLRNYWVSLSAFFTWATHELGLPNPMRRVPAPRFAPVVVPPFTREEIEQLLKAAEYCHEAQTTRRRLCWLPL